ncbi:MAG: SIS domain-containing protein [Gaiellaceae bacterium]|jgi:D-sedoheptulose 7-phosphate isomerase
MSGHVDVRGRVAAAFEEARALHALVGEAMVAPVAAAVDALASCLAGGGKVLAFRNGGSAADAQHLAGELVGRFRRDRRGLPAIALTTDSSILTAVANDFGFADVFARQVRALARPGDVVIAISASGRSENVLRAVAAARALGVTTVRT